MTSECEEKTLRYRRAQSVTKAEEITEKEKRIRKSQTDKPCHVPRDSLFSWSSEFADFTGLVNWGFLLLSIGGLRLGLENFIKYGVRVNPLEWVIFLTGYSEGAQHQYPSVILIMFSIIPAVFSLVVEKAIAVEFLSSKVGEIVQVVNIVFLISLPVVLIQIRGEDFSFVGISSVCMLYLLIFLKLWSYVQTNRWCRISRKNKFKKTTLRRQSLSAPNYSMVSLGKLFSFMGTIILIRKRFLIKRILEVVFGVNLMLALFQQWIMPSVSSSYVQFSEMGLARITERLLKLAVPNHLIWLCFFYLTFHSFLNLMGELLHFADRSFYNDWWNANNINVFWRTWNMPVHRWAVRHVYIPVTEMGYSKGTASVLVFFISAFFHEYLVSVPLQMFRIWAFLGMMAQLPLSVISGLAEKHFGPRWGNLIVWSSLIIGQPLVIMMYYHDYALTYLKSV